MIVARLHVAQSPDGRKFLAGRVVSDWPLKRGCPLVLLKGANGEYELSELGPRDVRLSPDGFKTFVGDDEGGHCDAGPSRSTTDSMPQWEPRTWW